MILKVKKNPNTNKPQKLAKLVKLHPIWSHWLKQNSVTVEDVLSMQYLHLNKVYK